MSATISDIEASDTVMVRELRRRVVELEREGADLQRQVAELRGALKALLSPVSELSGNE